MEIYILPLHDLHNIQWNMLQEYIKNRVHFEKMQRDFLFCADTWVKTVNRLEGARCGGQMKCASARLGELRGRSPFSRSRAAAIAQRSDAPRHFILGIA